jgi:hypothetical protein
MWISCYEGKCFQGRFEVKRRIVRKSHREKRKSFLRKEMYGDIA